MKTRVLAVLMLFAFPLYSQNRTFVRSYTYASGIVDNETTSSAIALYNVKHELVQDVCAYLRNFAGAGLPVNASLVSRPDSYGLYSILDGVTDPVIIKKHWSGKKYSVRASLTVDGGTLDNLISIIESDRDKMQDLETASREADSAAAAMDSLRSLITRDHDARNNAGVTEQYATASRVLSARYWFQKGYAATVANKVDERILCFRKATELDSSYPEAYRNLGLAYYSGGDTATAISTVKKAITLRPAYSRAYDDLGFFLAGEDSLDDAILMYGKAIELDPTDSYGYDDMGFAYFKKGDQEKAMECHVLAIGVDSSDAYGYAALGFYDVMADSVEKGIPLLEKAIELQPYNAFAYDNLGIAYSKLGSMDTAILYYKKAIGIDPRRPHPYYNLGDAFSKKGNSDSAIVMYTEAIKLDPKFAIAYYSLGLAYNNTGETAKGIDCLNKAALLGYKQAREWLDQNGYAK